MGMLPYQSCRLADVWQSYVLTFLDSSCLPNRCAMHAAPLEAESDSRVATEGLGSYNSNCIVTRTEYMIAGCIKL